ncbi:glucose-6-phosphate 1-dehydrogenase [Caldalkalibacillus uzonensis]|uniref:Glucose-6-phosphate 1-dehydrogenase n=1 Tax=Caldalkalibacillus uzonensis TaxID=353224 RepID=A0ABU0CX43_9BACI|nr:glucose-6-phosphate dehydrogenase [Caldalkalibacillus uzonensis]MDQ0339662.1 glucose-6-phosphate 1-dehydrogenase [Caldalkalibacillus uzonensis]
MTEAATMILFGATGDLAKRKLFPALYSLFREHQLPEQFAVVGVGRRSLSQDVFREHVKSSIESFARYPVNNEWRDFISRFFYVSLDIEEVEDYQTLLHTIETVEHDFNIPENRLFYLAIAPELFEPVTFHLQQAGILKQRGWKRVVIEKPFGHDLRSAEVLNEKIGQVFREEEIYRIDHYLGKEMVQNIEVIRFANTLFEPVWNNQYISNVQITSSEVVGVEGRARYYDHAGALRDMVQNHMLQMMTMVAMEPPSRLKPEAIRDEKVKVLRSIRRMHQAEEISRHVVRAQYLAGEIDSQTVKGYVEEEKVNPNSQTETFVAAKFYIDNFRWAGIPFYIRTGKRLAKKATEVIIQFKQLPPLYYNQSGQLEPNVLVIRIYPENGIYLKLNLRQPEDTDKIAPVSMSFTQNSSPGFHSPEAYERLVKDCLEGDSTYFTRWDEVALAWKIVDPIVRTFESGEVPLYTYKAGSWGPQEAEQLVAHDGLKWWPVLK